MNVSDRASSSGDFVAQVQGYAIVSLDVEGDVVTWNRGAEQLEGYRADEAVGRSFALFFTPEDQTAGLPAQLLAQAERLGNVQYSGWRVRKDGSRFWGDMVMTALRDEDGTLSGFAKVVRDCSDLKALEVTRDAFYAAFDHDCRVPLTAIKGFADALRDVEGEAQHLLIEKIEENTDRVLGMVQALMQFASRDPGAPGLKREVLDLRQVCRSVVRGLAPRIGPERVRVADVGLAVLGDRTAMHRTLTNLVVNALRYSDRDTEVLIDFHPTGDGRVRLTVTDSGRGIEAADLDTIFDPFSRGRLAADDGGTGLGLTSARDLVHQQGGSIRIDSEVGVGTMVTVELPAAPLEVPVQGRRRPPTGTDPQPEPNRQQDQRRVRGRRRGPGQWSPRVAGQPAG